MTQRSIGIDLAIRGDHVAQIFEDGHPVGRPIRLRHAPDSLDAFIARALAGLDECDPVQAIMEPTGMSWFPVGKQLAPILLGVLHTVERFRSVRQMRGFCGLFPRRADSGGKENPGRPITQGGNDRIKRALFLAADTARKSDPELAEIYWRLMTVKGHHHKQALCAVANRLANRIYSVMRRGQPYILRHLDGSEITIAQAKTIVAERYTVSENIRAGRRANRSQSAA